ncbi:MAG TPA: uracil-DNA glycosylase, partial [Bradyrhizobium sp.]
MTPDRAPNVQQLLTFYLEAGVDCALVEEPVNRLSDPDIVPGPREIPSPHETPPPATVRTPVAAIPDARGEPAPLP